jgi:hypothetical protein
VIAEVVIRIQTILVILKHVTEHNRDKPLIIILKKTIMMLENLAQYEVQNANEISGGLTTVEYIIILA